MNKETLRQWMIADGLRQEKWRKMAKVHQSHQRRSCFGELVQLDGRIITGLLNRKLSGGTSTWREYLTHCGRPLAFYSNKDSLFRINQPEVSAERQTQFERAMQDLDIELIVRRPMGRSRIA